MTNLATSAAGARHFVSEEEIASFYQTSYWNGPEYLKLIAGRWDVVVIMGWGSDLGGWFFDDGCDASHASSALTTRCPLIKGYVDLIDVIRDLPSSVPGRAPDIFLAFPPAWPFKFGCPPRRTCPWTGSFDGNKRTMGLFRTQISLVARAARIDADHIIDTYTRAVELGEDLHCDPLLRCTELDTSGCFASVAEMRASRHDATCSFYCDEKWCDGIHPADDGYATLARIVADQILSVRQRQVLHAHAADHATPQATKTAGTLALLGGVTATLALTTRVLRHRRGRAPAGML